MKKTGLFKIIMFILLGILIVTWFVPASYYSNGELADLGMYRIGFFDFFQHLFGTFQFSYFIQTVILLVSIGALYGVLVKTGKYKELVDKIASKFKRKELVFLVIVAFILAGLMSVFDYGLCLFIFIPFIISIVLAMGYNKITALLTTIGAMLVGVIGNTMNDSIVGSVNQVVTESTFATGIYYKIALFVLSFAALVFFLAKAKIKKSKDSKEVDMFAGEEVKSKKSSTPIVIIFIILFVLLVLGCTSWSTLFNVSWFTELNTTITEFKVNDTTIFAYILGTISALGEWYYAEMSVMCILAALLIGKIYKNTISTTCANMVEGAKKMMVPALYVMLCYTVVYFCGNTLFFGTIADWLLNVTKHFSVFFSSVTMFIGSALHVDMLYVSNYVVPQLAGLYDKQQVLVTVLSQGMYGVAMFAVPTSAFLVLGLTYLNVPYKEWLKSTWKLLVTLLVIVVLVLVAARYVF